VIKGKDKQMKCHLSQAENRQDLFKYTKASFHSKQSLKKRVRKLLQKCFALWDKEMGPKMLFWFKPLHI